MAIEQIRMFLIIGLCVVSYLLWDAWQRDYGPKPAAPAPDTAQPDPDAAPAEASPSDVDVPQAPQPTQAAAEAAPAPREGVGETARGRKISVTTDVLGCRNRHQGGNDFPGRSPFLPGFERQAGRGLPIARRRRP